VERWVNRAALSFISKLPLAPFNLGIFRYICIISDGGEIISAFGLREGAGGDADGVKKITDRARGRRAQKRLEGGERLVSEAHQMPLLRGEPPSPRAVPPPGGGAAPGSLTLYDPPPKIVRKSFSHACWPKVPALGFN